MKLKALLIPGFCFLIGLFLMLQSGVVEGESVYISARTLSEVRISIEGEESEIENIRNKIDEERERLALYETAKENNDFSEISEQLSEELLKYGMFSGHKTVSGPGVRVIVDDGTRPLFDGEDINNVLVHDIDIIIVINDLKRSGAEAISVNGQRVVDVTEIICSGYTIRINGQVFARPFIIRAIGDSRRMSSMLLSPEGYGAMLKEFGVSFSVELLEELVIQGHPGTIGYRYMTDAKEVL